jgi:iron(III) transport system substrate-binding protein
VTAHPARVPSTSARRVWALAAVVGLVLAAAACGGSGGSSGSGGSNGSSGAGDPGGSNVTLTVYNAQHEETTDALLKAFTAQTGIKVRVKSDDESVLTAQIEEEGDRSPADVFYTENSNWLQQLAGRGMLTRVSASTLADVPARDSATGGDWVGVSARYSVLIYNPSKISAADLPRTVLAMADPRYKGKLELAPGETDFWPIVTSVERAYGRSAALSWLEGLKANAGSEDDTADNETLVSDVSKGVAAMGLINHYYYYRLRDELGAANVHAKLSFLAPGDPGYVEDVSGAAILKSSKHQAAAQKLLAFMTSAAGQRVLASSTSFEYPLARGVTANPVLPPADTLKPNSITPAQIGTGLGARDLLQQAGLI